MACNALNTSYTIPCKGNLVGGSKRFIINTYSASTVYNTDSTTEIVTGATSATPYYNFPQRLETAEVKSDVATTVDTAPRYQHSATLVLNGWDYTNRKLLKSLIDNDLNIIVQTNNDKYFMLERAYVSASPISLGKAFGDMVGATVTFTSVSADPLKEVSAAYVASLTIS